MNKLSNVISRALGCINFSVAVICSLLAIIEPGPNTSLLLASLANLMAGLVLFYVAE